MKRSNRIACTRTHSRRGWPCDCSAWIMHVKRPQQLPPWHNKNKKTFSIHQQLIAWYHDTLWNSVKIREIDYINHTKNYPRHPEISPFSDWIGELNEKYHANEIEQTLPKHSTLAILSWARLKILYWISSRWPWWWASSLFFFFWEYKHDNRIIVDNALFRWYRPHRTYTQIHGKAINTQ